MTGNEYQSAAMRTNDGCATRRLLGLVYKLQGAFDDRSVGEILDSCLGLSGEVGEMNDLIKKWIFHEKELDEVHLKKELGDVMWYVAMMCHGFGWDLDEILQMNVDKLKARYPDGFDVNRANNRKEGDV